MSRRLWMLCCALVPLLVASVPTLAIAGIWTGIGRLLAISGVLLFVCLPVVPLFWIWTEDHRPEPLLPLRQRRALRREQSRIRMEKAIADAEREAGIQ